MERINSKSCSRLLLSKIHEWHTWNQARVRKLMGMWRSRDECTIIVPNTLPRIAYMIPYCQMANEFGFEVQVITMQRELRVCEMENAWSDVPTGQIRGQIHYTEFLPLDTVMSIVRGDLTDQYCFDCGYAPCRCEKEGRHDG